MYIIELTYIKPIEEVDRHIAAHREFLNKYYETGNFLVSGRKVPRTGGVILALFPTRQSMDEAIQNDPFFKNGVARYTITEIEPTQSNDLLKPLLGT